MCEWHACASIAANPDHPLGAGFRQVSLIALCLAASAAGIVGADPQETTQQSRFFEVRREGMYC